MKTTHRPFIAIVALCILGSIQTCHADGPYRFLKEIPVGGDGGWDYLTVGAAARRLYVTHATKIVVIDLDKDAVVGEITDTPGVHGLALAPELGRGFSSNGRENKSSIVDLKTLKTLAKVDTGENPDAILYEPGRQEVYTFNGRSQTATMFDANTVKLVATFPLPGKPEFAVYDSNTKNIYCNIEDKNEVVVIRATKMRFIQATWPLAPGEEPTGLAVDAAQHRLFVGCHNQLLMMLDSTTGKVITSAPIGQGVDAVVFDAGTQFVFSSNRDGTVTIAHEDAPDKLTVVQTLVTERGARTMALDPKTHEIYLASAKFEPAAAGQRPKIIAGSLKILVYGLVEK